MPPHPQPEPGILLYQTEDGRTRIQCRLEHETIWLTQAQIAELFQTSVHYINLYIEAIYAEGELTEQATRKQYLQVATQHPPQRANSTPPPRRPAAAPILQIRTRRVRNH